MKIAFLMQCHKNSIQINRLIDKLKHPEVDVYIHIDSKSQRLREEIKRNENVHLLPNEKCVDVQWGTFSQVTATLNLIEFARTNGGGYSYYWIISGQDYLLKPINKIVEILGKNQEYNYIQTTQSLKFSKRNDVYFWKFMIGRSFWRKVIKNIWIYGTGGWNNTYSVFKRESPNGVKYWFGSSWWCLNENMISWMIEYLDKNSEYIKFFNNCLCADECFFQTLVMNSPYSNSVVDYPYYIDWEEGKSSPKVLRMKDFEKLSCSDKMMARKFDMDVDEEILDALDDISKHC